MKKDNQKSGEGFILESIHQGRYLKVTAIDEVTGMEASVVGPADPVSHKLLEKQAIKKLIKIISESKN